MKILFFLAILVPFQLVAQFDFEPSEAMQISVITCGPSQEELYSAFGHSAIRVYDPTHGFDAAFNYGVFDFDQPNFYLNFARGYLYYKLGVYDYQRFQAAYIYDNRYVHEQVLNLNAEQKRKLFHYLRHNARPENQTYRYDYFYNNCATKIRDVIVDALGSDVVKFDGTFILTDYSIRDLTDIYLEEQPWGDLGIDICLGLPMDKTASPYEYMFLPDYVESSFDHAVILGDSGVQPIVASKVNVYDARPMEAEAGLPHPVYFSLALMIMAFVVSFIDLNRQQLSNWLDVVLFGATGAIGFLLFFLWFFTDHAAAARNLNLLWAFPGHLIAAIAFVRNPGWLRQYFLFALILSALTLIAWPILPQALNRSLIPLVIALAARSFTQHRVRSRVRTTLPA